MTENISRKSLKKVRRVYTPTVLQMEAVECGAAALGIILAYYGCNVPLEELRRDCGVSRDGSRADNIVKAAKKYGLKGNFYKKEPAALFSTVKMPVLVFWDFCHYVVVEGCSRSKVFLNDPATGPRTVSVEEFDESFTGVAMYFEPGENFKKRGVLLTDFKRVFRRLKGLEDGLVFAVLATLFLVLPGLAVPVFLRVFVDKIMVKQMYGWVPALLIGMAIVMIVRSVLTWVQQFYLLRTQTKMVLKSTSNFMWHVLRLPIQFFSQRYAAEITQRSQLNDTLANIFSGQLATAFLNIIMVVFYGIVLFLYSWPLALIGIITIMANFAFLSKMSRSRRDTCLKMMQEKGKMTATTMAAFQMIETIKAQASEDEVFNYWAGFQAKAANCSQQLGKTVQQMVVMPQFLMLANRFIVLCAGALLIIHGKMTVGELVAFQMLMEFFIAPVMQLVALGGSVQDAMACMKRLDDVVDYPLDPDIDERMDKKWDILSDKDLTGNIELENISFGYNPLDESLIKDFNLTFKPGYRIALAGSSGSGKSTVAKIVAGLLQPWSGEVLFDGIPRRKVPNYILRNSLSMVDQDIFLFEGTVMDNLTLWDETIPKADVAKACRDACIDDVLAQRANGYDSIVEEGGKNFSVGQKQRIEIARALVGNPRILILDEATNSLDPATEKQIDENLRRRGCTCLIIAHRLSTIRDADEIVLLDHGKVAERGSHEELMKLNGRYAKLLAEDDSTQV